MLLRISIAVLGILALAQVLPAAEPATVEPAEEARGRIAQTEGLVLVDLYADW